MAVINIKPCKVLDYMLNITLSMFLLLLSCTTNTESVDSTKTDVQDSIDYKLVEAFPNLTFDRPIEFIAAPDGSASYYVVEQAGKINRVEKTNESWNARVILDIVNKVNSGGEKGLLGLDFDPDFLRTMVSFSLIIPEDKN